MATLSSIGSDEAFAKFTAAVTTGKTAVLVGAGISTLAPSTLPSGVALKDLIVDNIFYLPEFQPALIKLKANPKFASIIPEVLFQEIFSAIGNRIFNIYQLLSLADPNILHFTLAHIANKYPAKIYTTNFDLLVDRFLSHEQSINHLHGSLNKPTEMVILINQVGKGINRKNKIDFQKNTSGGTLLVLGYSGNDNDVIQLINQSGIKDILWLVRDLKDEWVLKNVRNIKNIPCALFKEDLASFAERLVRSFTPGRLDGAAADYGTEKARIVERFKFDLSLFERYYILHLILFRIEDYQACLAFGRICLNRRMKSTFEQRLLATAALGDAIRVIGTDIQAGHRVVNKVLKMEETKRYPFLLGRLNNCKGLLFLEAKKGKPRVGIRFFEAAIALYLSCLKKEKNRINQQRIKTALGGAYNNLGLAYDTLHVYDKSIVAYERSLIIKRRLGNLIGISVTQVNICIAYLKSGNFRQSAAWEKKALKIIDKYDQHYRKAFLYRQKGFNLVKVDPPMAVKLLKQALAIYQEYTPSAEFDIQLTTERLSYAESLHS